MEKEFITETRKEKTIGHSRKNWEFADEIYIFCPGIARGIRFYDHSPQNVVANFSGSLQPEKFWAEEVTIVEWDDKINGTRYDNIPVTTTKSYLLNKKNFLAKRTQLYGSGFSSYNTYTIIVSQHTFISILDQIGENKTLTDNGHTIINLNTMIVPYDLKNINQEINQFNLYTEYQNKKKH